MQMSINERFPVEVIHMILSHLNSIEVARNSRVCMLWNNLAQKHKDLWKDASYLVNENAFRPFEIAVKRIKILRARSGGTLDHLNIHINTSFDFEAQMDFLSELPAMNVQHLGLLLNDGSRWKYMDRYNNDLETFASMQFAIRTALARCASLRSLNIDDNGHFLESTQRQRNRFEWERYPISQCKLESFTLRDFNYDDWIREGVLFRLLSQARIIKITVYPFMLERDVICLMEGAKDTLEECKFSLQGERDSSMKNVRQIIIPKLIKFDLSYLAAGDGRFSVRTFQNVSFQWPRLKELIFRGEGRLKLYERLTPTSLESLAFRKIQELPLNKIISFLKERSSLKKLAIEDLEEDKDTLLHEILINLPHIPLEELEIVGVRGIHCKTLTDFIKLRRKNSLSTSIKRLHLIFPSRIMLGSKTLEWLNGEIEDFKCEISPKRRR